MSLAARKILDLGRVLCVIAVLMCANALPKETASPRKDQLKAAYLFNFMKFIEWPRATANETITVCFLGGENVQNAMAAGIENKRVAGRSLQVRRLTQSRDVTGCSVLYLDSGAVSQQSGWLSGAITPAVLTVSDAKQFTRDGGMIELFSDSNRLRFNVNVENASRAGLRISSDLLQLAAAVEKAGAK